MQGLWRWRPSSITACLCLGWCGGEEHRGTEMGVGRLRRTNERYLAPRVGPGEVVWAAASRRAAATRRRPRHFTQWRLAQLHQTPLVNFKGLNKIEKSILTVSSWRRGRTCPALLIFHVGNPNVSFRVQTNHAAAAGCITVVIVHRRIQAFMYLPRVAV